MKKIKNKSGYKNGGPRLNKYLWGDAKKIVRSYYYEYSKKNWI